MSEQACSKKCRGRPKQFDPDIALDRALEVFWRHGYEATSMSELVEATGAKAPTLYAAFGNKEGLFCAALERYLAKYTQDSRQLLQQDDLPIAEIIDRFMRMTANLFTDPDNPAGCFMISSSAALSASAETVAEMLHKKHLQQESNLKNCFDRKVQQGELLSKTDTQMLTKYVYANIQGMSTQARDGASRADLFKLVDLLMLLWPRLSQVGNPV